MIEVVYWLSQLCFRVCLKKDPKADPVLELEAGLGAEEDEKGEKVEADEEEDEEASAIVTVDDIEEDREHRHRTPWTVVEMK